MKHKSYLHRLLQRMFASFFYNLLLATKRSVELTREAGQKLGAVQANGGPVGVGGGGTVAKPCFQAEKLVDIQAVFWLLTLLAGVSTFMLWFSVSSLYQAIMTSWLIRRLAKSARYYCSLKSPAVGRILIVMMWALVGFGLISTSVLWRSLDSVEQDGGEHGFSHWLTRLRRSIDLASDPNQRVSIRSKDIRYGVSDELCEENDFAGSDGNVSLNMNWTELYHAEEEILGTSTNAIRRYLRTDNKLMQSIYIDAAHGRQRSHRKQPSASLTDALSEGLLINDYYYVSGGHWIPAKCHPRWKVAVIVPFRDRFFQLPIFLRNIVPFLKRQKLEFGIYIVEQANWKEFNRAMLMNVGFQQALNFTHWDCFIFHDVDHLPLNDANYYGCSHMPRHFISGADRWNYKLQYSFFFGAVTGFTRSQIQKFNGFPNVYWGWGGEDDDILIRIQNNGFFKTRPWGVTGFYNVIAEHHKSAPKNRKRVCLLDYARQRLKTDGLSNLVYPPARVTLTPLYTNISVNITDLAWHPGWKVCTQDYKRAKKDEVVAQ